MDSLSRNDHVNNTSRNPSEGQQCICIPLRNHTDEILSRTTFFRCRSEAVVYSTEVTETARFSSVRHGSYTFPCFGVPPTPDTNHDDKRINCLNPEHPHMNCVSRRINTFRHGWSNNTLRASTEDLARAGFFYLGECDKVRCFYCDGGLQNWELDDDPWVEHEKWYPTCDYLKQHKRYNLVMNTTQPNPSQNTATHHPHGNPPLQVHESQQHHQQHMKRELKCLGFKEEEIDFIITRQESNIYNIDDLARDLLENLVKQITSARKNTFEGNFHIGKQSRTSDNNPAMTKCRKSSLESIPRRTSNASCKSSTANPYDDARADEVERHPSRGLPRQNMRGKTESDAYPIVYSSTSDAEVATYSFMRDNALEIHRLASFHGWCYPTVSSISLAAKEGFYYTGNSDEARCFSCARIWNIRQTYNSNLHSSNCEMMNEQAESGNVPCSTSTNLQELIHRILTPTKRLSASVEENETSPHAASKRPRFSEPGSSLP